MCFERATLVDDSYTGGSFLRSGLIARRNRDCEVDDTSEEYQSHQISDCHYDVVCHSVFPHPHSLLLSCTIDFCILPIWGGYIMKCLCSSCEEKGIPTSVRGAEAVR